MGHQSCERCKAAETRLLLRENQRGSVDWRFTALAIVMLISIALAVLAG